MKKKKRKKKGYIKKKKKSTRLANFQNINGNKNKSRIVINKKKLLKRLKKVPMKVSINIANKSPKLATNGPNTLSFHFFFFSFEKAKFFLKKKKEKEKKERKKIILDQLNILLRSAKSQLLRILRPWLSKLLQKLLSQIGKG